MATTGSPTATDKAGTPTASGGATPAGAGTPGATTPGGGPRLVVRNTFLEVFDDPPLEAEGAQQRRPRAQTDITDAKMPKKVSYPMDGQSEQNYFGGGSPVLGYGLPPHLGGIPEDMMTAALRPPAGFPPMPGYGFPPWGMPGMPGMPPPFPGMPGMPPWGFPPMGMPMGKGNHNQGGGRGGGAGRRQAEKGGGKQDRGAKGGGKSDKNDFSKGAGGSGRGGIAPVPKGQRNDVEAVQSPVQVAERHPTGTETTVMLRNIPNRYTQGMLLSLLDEHNFKSCYDFVYLPMDFRNGVNLGYAFVNLASNEESLRVMSQFQGFSRWYFDSAKVCEVSWAHPHQGLHDHVERYRNSPVMHPSMPEEYKPMIFKDGERIVFPLPTKAIRAPKLRPVHDAPDGGGPATSF